MGEITKVHRYTGNDAIITWDASRCIHAAACIRRAPQAFDPKARPWINPEHAEREDLADAVNRCPSGALAMHYADGSSAMLTPPMNTCLVTANGPNYVRGKLILKRGDEVVTTDSRMALCRCGASQMKPFCDNSHKTSGFVHDGGLRAAKSAAPDTDFAAPLTLKPAADGPMFCAGPLTIRDASGRSAFSDQTFLCRCGGSQNKPYCDGTHRKIGFTG